MLILTSSWPFVRLPSDTTSPKADISTWPEADIFILLLQVNV